MPLVSTSSSLKTTSSILLVLVAVFGLACAADAEAVKTWEGTITLPTYAWHDDVNPVFAELEGKIYYPYTRQDHIAQTKADRTYKALFLENEYLKVTCLPELGGRIHSVLDKTTGEEMFHKNDVIKPALIAMRGAWIGGGIEWNVGPQGHTVTIVSPVDAVVVRGKDGSATLVVGNTEKMFRTRWTVRLTLHPGKAYLDETIRIFNPTDGVHPYYFWNCTGFPNLPGTRFIYPMTLGSDHNGTTFFSWPMDKGKDLSWLKNYDTMTSIFAYDCVFDFFGAYDADRDRGIVSYANHHEVKGKKAWTWGKDGFGVVSQMALSDAGPEDAQYIEVQSGPLLTQADYGMLGPRQDVSWREYWYPVHGLGDGFEYATRDVAVQTYRDGGKLEVHVIGTASFRDARCTLSQNGAALLERTVDLSPERAQTIALASTPDGPITITIRAADGATLVSYATPLAVPKVDAPDLAKKPAREDGTPTADELFQSAYLADSQSNPNGARSGYEKVLENDPGHVPSLCALAELDIELGRFDEAAGRAEKALERHADHGTAWYLLGVSRLHQNALDEAIRCGYKAAHDPATLALGYGLVGRVHMCTGAYDEAVAAFGRAMRRNPEDTRNRDQWLAARYAAGDTKRVARDAATLTKADDPTDFIPRALVALKNEKTMAKFMQDVNEIAGEIEFTLIEVVTFFAGLNRYEEAVHLLEARSSGSLPCYYTLVVEAGAESFEALYSDDVSGALPWYYLAYYRHKLGDEAAAKTALRKAAAKPYDYAFPSRVEAEDVLRYAVESNKADAQARLMLGHLLAALRRTDEAVPYWEEAVELDLSLSTAWRSLGYHAWKKQSKLDRAEQCYRKAIAARPENQILYHDLAQILSGLERQDEAIQLVETMPVGDFKRYDICLWLAQAYVSADRYDDCIAFLGEARFSNWEGSSTPRVLYVQALMARGKLRFDAGQHERALADFRAALTYPENLHVGQRYKRTDAETHYWLGKTLAALGSAVEARAVWREGAKQITSSDPPLTFISVTAIQDEHVKLCAEALETP